MLYEFLPELHVLLYIKNVHAPVYFAHKMEMTQMLICYETWWNAIDIYKILQQIYED
jgi:hypothetical protein